MSTKRSTAIRLAFLALAFVAARPAAAALDRFTPARPPEGQLLAAVPDPFTPGTVLLMTDYFGLFRSADSGHTWSWSGAGLGTQELLEGVAADPSQPGSF